MLEQPMQAGAGALLLRLSCRWSLPDVRWILLHS
jgi:hypothetical protein